MIVSIVTLVLWAWINGEVQALHRIVLTFTAKGLTKRQTSGSRP